MTKVKLTTSLFITKCSIQTKLIGLMESPFDVMFLTLLPDDTPSVLSVDDTVLGTVADVYIVVDVQV